MMTIVSIVGARPQFIKAAVQSKAINAAGCHELLVHTGQHADARMSEVFFTELGLKAPAAHLGIGGGTHGQNTGRMIAAIEDFLLNAKPDAVIVYGDTDSTLAGAIATCKLGIPLGHVEAGLRSWNRTMPEELNRVLTDHASDALYAPTKTAVANLISEGVPQGRVALVGDLMLEAIHVFDRQIDLAERRVLHQLSIPSDFDLFTLHRPGNVDERLRLSAILHALADSDRTFVFPVHPRTSARLRQFDLNPPSNVISIEPVGYFDAQALIRRSRLVLTDSGGMQKEAYFHGVNSLVLREETEWVELVELGASQLVGAMVDELPTILAATPPPASIRADLFGNGDTSMLTTEDLLSRL